MKKKVLAVMMSMMMLVSMALPVSAAGQDGTTTLNTSKKSEYTLSIPADTKDIKYGDVDTPIGNLTVTGNVNVGETVSVSAVTNAFQRIGNTSDEIAFSLMDITTSGSPKVYATTTWNEAALRAESKKVPLSVNIPTATWNSAKAGAYTGSIVFNATLK